MTLIHWKRIMQFAIAISIYATFPAFMKHKNSCLTISCPNRLTPIMFGT